MFIEPKENESYKEYISRILNSRKNKKDEAAYQELHHITPRCMGGKDDDENLIYLYPEEHYYAHKLLALENPDNAGLRYAWVSMSSETQGRRLHDHKLRISANEYKLAKEQYSEYQKDKMKNEGNPMYGRHHTEEAKEKLREHHSPNSTTKGWHPTEETKEKMRDKKIGLYDGAKNPRARKVYCIELDMTFNCIKDAADYVGISNTKIISYLSGKEGRKSAGKHPETKVPLHWLYA